MAYVAAQSGALPVRSQLVSRARPARPPETRPGGPVHVADLLSREGHPLAGRVSASRDAVVRAADPRTFDAGASVRRSLGIAAGAALVVGTVVAGALGLNHSAPSPTAAAGEPVGALPGKGAPAQLGQAPGAPGAVAPVSPRFTNLASSQSLQTAPAPAGEVGIPAKVAPRPAPPAAAGGQQAPAAAEPAPSQGSGGLPQPVTQPVTQAAGGVTQTLTSAVTPVTSTVEDTLQPALSLIGGLLGHR